MAAKNIKGITLIENLIAILLVSALLIGVMGAFFISKVGTSRSKHRMVAMNLIKEYTEQEIAAGYDGGAGSGYYVTVSSAAGNSVTIDDNVQGAIAPDPYYPNNIEDAAGDPLIYSGVPYKVIGFIVTWNEPATGHVCTERAVVYVSYHSST